MKFKFLALAFLLLSTHSFALEVKVSAQAGSKPKYDPSNKDRPGVCLEIYNAMEKADPDLKFVGKDALTPLKRVEEQLSNNEIDIFLGLVKTEARAKIFDYIVPLYETKVKMIVNTDDNVSVASFDDIKKLGDQGIVSVVQGQVYEAFVKKQEGVLLDNSGTDISANMRKLALKRVRFHYNTSLNFSEVESNPEFKGKFKMLPHVFNTENQHMVASKKIAPETLKKVLAAFEKIKASGELDKINKKYLPE